MRFTPAELNICLAVPPCCVTHHCQCKLPYLQPCLQYLCSEALCCWVTQYICRFSLLHVSDVAVAYHAANSGANIWQYGRHSCPAYHGGHSRHIPAASLRHAQDQPIAHVHVQQQGQDAQHEPCSYGSLPLLRSSHLLPRPDTLTRCQRRAHGCSLCTAVGFLHTKLWLGTCCLQTVCYA